MKYIDWIFVMVQSPLLAAWMLTAKDTLSFFLATLLSVITILYIYEKWRVVKVDRKLKERELKRLQDEED